MKKVLLVIVLAMLAVAIMPAAAQDKPFAGKKIVITTQTGSAIGGPAQKYGQEWAEKNGATIEVQQFAFGDLFPKIIESVKNDTAAFDILIYASDWMGDIAGGGYVSEVPEAIKTAVGWDDILPLYRERIANWGGKTYAIPFDGDSHMMYYRKDLVNPTSAYAADFQAKYGYELAEPKTWAQYKDIAEFFNGKDVDTAGTMGPISGVVEAQKRSAQSFWFLMTRSAGYAKVPGNPYFFFNEEMKAQVNTPGWVKGLQDWVDISPYGVSGMINFDVSEVRQLFPAGQTVFGLDWGDVGPISVDPNASVVKGLVGFSPAPGGDQYWDPAADGGKGAWVKPESGVNSAPFISFGGWVMSVAANSQVQEAAFDLAAYLGGQELSTTLSVTGGTGVNPFRKSTFDNVDAWVAAGFDEESAKDYLGAIVSIIDDPNAVLDLRIPGAFEYFSLLDVGIAKALTGEATAQVALDEVAAGWDALTERLGKDSQLKLYKESLGIQ